MSGNKNKKNTCTKVKNGCKFCLEAVTPRNGLQCQGACQKWAHYKCLSYTPGKISDIKAGLIKVMCPCPDCDTTQPKEYQTNPPYSCSSHKCPANGPIKCDSDACPQNEGRKKEIECSTKTCTNDKAEAPMDLNTQAQRKTGAVPTRLNAAPHRPALPTPKRLPAEARRKEYRRIPIPKNSADSCLSPCCPNRTSNTSVSDDENCPKTQQLMAEALQEMSGTVGKLSTQIKDLMGKINKMA